MENEKEFFCKTLQLLESVLPIWTVYCKEHTIEYVDSNVQYHKADKKMVQKSLQALRANGITKNKLVQKAITYRLEKLSIQTSQLVKENEKGNLKLPKEVLLVLKVTNTLTRYTLKKDNVLLAESQELVSKVISENSLFNEHPESCPDHWLSTVL